MKMHSLFFPHHHLPYILPLLLLFLLNPIPLSLASSGDQGLPFRQCMHHCTFTGCTDIQQDDQGTIIHKSNCSSLCGGNTSTTIKYTTPIALQYWKWDCTSDCSYLCMWKLEAAKTTTGEVEKYYGKWPFVRYMGMQEPASVIFSILNLAVHTYALIKLSKRLIKSKTSSSLKAKSSSSSSSSSSPSQFAALWLLHITVTINAWLWSAVFHGRDTRLTERLDYFSAGAHIALSLFISIVRLTDLTQPLLQAAVACPIFLYYLQHCHRMLTVLFDYGRHVKLCIIAGGVQSVAWLVWSIFTPRGKVHPRRKELLWFVVLVNVAMLFEVLDFPPLWYIYDAHALWHAATVPLGVVWYRFVEADMFGSVGRGGAVMRKQQQKKTS